jgi:cytochrome c
MKNFSISTEVTGVGILSALQYFSSSRTSKASGSTEDRKKALSKAKCAICHGADGAAKTARVQVQDEGCTLPDVQKMSDQQWYEIIVKGKART